MKHAAGGFLTGFLAPARGLKLAFTNGKVFRLMILPFVITTVVFFVGSVLGFMALSNYLPRLTSSMAREFGVNLESSGFVWFCILALAWATSIFALLFLLFLVARLVATPFYDALAERVLIEQGLLPPRAFALGEWSRSSARLVGVSLLKTLSFMVAGVILFLLAFVPGLGFVTAFGFLLMAAFDVVDVSFEALRMGFRERITVFRSEFPAFVGLASVLGLVFLVPGLNFFLLPTAIAGSSEIIRRRRGIKSGGSNEGSRQRSQADRP